jgi:hypothetical protein
MIAFACAVQEPEAYERYAGPGIERAKEPDSPLHILAATSSVCRSLNLLLDQASGADDLEALVLVAENAEIADPGFCAEVRRALADPDVAVAGAIGATGVEGLAWWDGTVNGGRVVHRYEEYGGGDLPAYAWSRTGAPPAEVDTVAGFLLVLSPWAARSLRFDEGLSTGEGFDLDFCLRARQAGRRIVTADLGVVHHRSLELVEDKDGWIEAHIQLAEKWDGRLPGAPPRPEDWKQRARRAEAERDAAQTEVFSSYSRREARLTPLERQLSAMTDTPGWRLTAPLRRLNALRRARGGPRPSR